jgi:hypothetical protein
MQTWDVKIDFAITEKTFRDLVFNKAKGLIALLYILKTDS